MNSRLLIITKDPEFDDRGEVVLGQCEPFTSGWKLVLVHPDCKQEQLLAGSYTDLRKIQENCGTIVDVDKVRKRVSDMRTLINSAVTETVAVDFGQQDRSASATQLLDPTQTDFMPVVTDKRTQTTGDLFFELQRQEGILLALLADPERASDVALLNQNLRKLLEQKPKAIVLDLVRIQHLASRVVHELVLFRDQCEADGIAFGLCNLRKSVQKLFENIGHENPPTFYENSAAAVERVEQR